MSEQEIREGMLLAVWDEPPLDFDPDKLIRRVEQKKSRRRALVAVGVATAMIVVTSLALPGLLPRDQDGQLASNGQPPPSSAPPSVSAEKKGQRIGDKLTEKLGLRMTNFKEVYASFRGGAYAYNPNSPTTPPQRPWDPELSGFVHFTDEIGPTALRVILTKDRTVAEQICAGATTCRDVAQSDGTTVTEAQIMEGQELARSVVLRKFPSGYFAEISSFNYNPATGQGLRQAAPVPVEVLTTLVTDPDVHWE
ncbi:hypothetical protein [Lentzea aerocolonigenes]|uniref:hypothetical protein n=1 Tax=Lentzea aerocolonigenes TaxID=68170 RepID=UPI0004C379E0|nr:hypothetical protein [Lentzea aerocolonigenes]MCP2250787.1 hypothetical protein [Lentzea aerocolonigenes]